MRGKRIAQRRQHLEGKLKGAAMVSKHLGWGPDSLVSSSSFLMECTCQAVSGGSATHKGSPDGGASSWLQAGIILALLGRWKNVCMRVSFK